MSQHRTSFFRRAASSLLLILGLGLTAVAQQQPPKPPPGFGPPSPEQQAATEADHKNMMDQLGIKALRPGPSGNESAPNHANFDESLANPFPDIPDALTLKNGRKVTTPKEWWEQRRPEIAEDFEREVIGRIPKNVPKVTWTVTEKADGVLGGIPVTGRVVTGHVDNSAYPDVPVDIPLIVVTPTASKRPVPLMIMFSWGNLQQAIGAAPMPRFGPQPPPGGDPPGTEQLIADGWGFAFLNPNLVQADNGAGLTKGIIGLVNKGRFRKPDDWGALRAWAWGASRALDYFETDPAVDAKHVGIDGVSRYGKAALVTMAFDPRFAMVLVGSSGEGGAKLHRRNFGEAVENLTGSGEYHWMAGNFLKYGASEASFGSKTPGDLPVDAHELIAMCAPRLTFISYGVPEKGDAKWLDQQGSFMATVAAGRVFRMLGVKDLGVGDDFKNAKMPPVTEGLLDGQLAWRQHDGGHTDGPNWKTFIAWADRNIGHQAPPKSTADATVYGPADQPAPRTDANSMLAHEQLIVKAKQGKIDVYFVGDSIARRWGATDYPELLANWTQNFHGWNAGDFGWGADRIENMLWRLDHGELDGINPKVIVILAGTNNVGSTPGGDAKVDDITRGLRALVQRCRDTAPNATVVLTAIFPRNDNMAVVPEIVAINRNLAAMADGKTTRFLDVNASLADKDGVLVDGMMNAHDRLHPTLKGYQVWADGLKPILTELLGPPATTDAAPPPTGDPSAKPKPTPSS
jgi:lysophospholipase L1-like esterase